MRKVTLLLLACFVLGTVSAQLTTRENRAFQPKFGNLPQAGDAALQFVIPVSSIFGYNDDSRLYNGNLLQQGDFLTFKYYQTDNLVYRGAVRVVFDNFVTVGTQADSSEFNPIDEDFAIQDLKYKTIMNEFNLALGAEQHFARSNFFDVYAGGEILIGLGRDRSVREEDYFNGDKNYVTAVTPTRIFGFAGVVGFNIPVAELPISVGLEYGLSGKWLFSGKTKVKEEVDFEGGANYTAEYFTQQNNPFEALDNRLYSDLRRRTFNVNTNSQVRLNIHVYFGTRGQ